MKFDAPEQKVECIEGHSQCCWWQDKGTQTLETSLSYCFSPALPSPPSYPSKRLWSCKHPSEISKLKQFICINKKRNIDKIIDTSQRLTSKIFEIYA